MSELSNVELPGHHCQLATVKPQPTTVNPQL